MREVRVGLEPHRRTERTPWLCGGIYPSQTHASLTAGGDSIELGVCPVCGRHDLRLVTLARIGQQEVR